MARGLAATAMGAASFVLSGPAKAKNFVSLFEMMLLRRFMSRRAFGPVCFDLGVGVAKLFTVAGLEVVPWRFRLLFGSANSLDALGIAYLKLLVPCLE